MLLLMKKLLLLAAITSIQTNLVIGGNLRDPCTVEEKTDNHHKAPHEIRYATFGSSRGWGASLADRNTEVYVKLLDPNGGNYAIRSNGPNYPAACTYTMLKDDVYDVFILEFFNDLHQGLRELAIRLRERFPDAIIIILRVWDFHMLHNNGLNLFTWADKHGFNKMYKGVNPFIHDPKFREAFLQTNHEEWTWTFEHGNKAWVDGQDEIAKEVDGFVIPMPIPKKADGPDGYLALGDKYFAADSFHPSEYGHQDIANRVRDLVHRVGVPKRPRLGQFKDIDYCVDWFESGDVGQHLKYSANGNVDKMPNTTKYALSFEGGEGFIEITNPTSETLHLFIAYMTTYPERNYPETEASTLDGRKVILSPITELYNFKVHVGRFAQMGQVDPKSTIRVNFKELEESNWPFRLTQVVLTPHKNFGNMRTYLEPA